MSMIGWRQLGEVDSPTFPAIFRQWCGYARHASDGVVNWRVGRG